MKTIAVFASGRGSNFAAIIRSIRRGRLKAKIGVLVCDNPAALAIAKARRAKIPVEIVRREDYASKKEFEQHILGILKAQNVEFIALAGFMRIVGPTLLRTFAHRIINIHPALLPAFKGAHGIVDAFEYGVTVTGVTVHFVDEKTDHGPIIAQEAVRIKPGDTAASLEKRIHRVEHRLYPEALRLVLEGKLKVSGRKVIRFTA